MVFESIDRILNENFDITDRPTRMTIIEADDSEKLQIVQALTSKLYDMIVAKVSDIDFGTIPRSRGDITKIENYSQLMECIDILRGVIVQNKQDTYSVDVISSAVANINDRKRIFTKAFALNVELPILIYDTIVLAIVSSVDFIIKACIEYIKNPGSDTFEIAIDRVAYNNTRNNLLFENLATFNSACKSGAVDKAIDHVIRNNRIHEGADINVSDASNFKIVIKHDGEEDKEYEITKDQYDRLPIHDNDNPEDVTNEAGPLEMLGKIGYGVVTVFSLILPVLRSLVYFFYSRKQRFSDFLAKQAELIEMNAYKVQYSTDIADDKRAEIFRKQTAIARTIQGVSNRLSIDYKKAKKDVETMQNDENKKFTISDFPEITPSLSVQSSLF